MHKCIISGKIALLNCVHCAELHANVYIRKKCTKIENFHDDFMEMWKCGELILRLGKMRNRDLQIYPPEVPG